MSDAPTTTPVLSEEVKLSWEIKKLQAEVDALRRPFKNPSVIAALTTASFVAVVSLGGLLIQWSRSDREYTLAQIKAARLDLESELLQRRRTQLEREVALRSAELTKVQNELDKLAAALKNTQATNTELQSVQARLVAATGVLKAAAAPIVVPDPPPPVRSQPDQRNEPRHDTRR
ncbi:MAG TPA: hypothetical protein VF911_01340 [Thermoanaerobaculia bacterium]|jgi:C4-dicarboxylate-specific signal transduction histidine kinase